MTRNTKLFPESRKPIHNPARQGYNDHFTAKPQRPKDTAPRGLTPVSDDEIFHGVRLVFGGRGIAVPQQQVEPGGVPLLQDGAHVEHGLDRQRHRGPFVRRRVALVLEEGHPDSKLSVPVQTDVDGTETRNTARERGHRVSTTKHESTQAPLWREARKAKAPLGSLEKLLDRSLNSPRPCTCQRDGAYLQGVRPSSLPRRSHRQPSLQERPSPIFAGWGSGPGLQGHNF